MKDEFWRGAVGSWIHIYTNQQRIQDEIKITDIITGIAPVDENRFNINFDDEDDDDGWCD